MTTEAYTLNYMINGAMRQKDNSKRPLFLSTKENFRPLSPNKNSL